MNSEIWEFTHWINSNSKLKPQMFLCKKILLTIMCLFTVQFRTDFYLTINKQNTGHQGTEWNTHTNTSESERELVVSTNGVLGSCMEVREHIEFVNVFNTNGWDDENSETMAKLIKYKLLFMWINE